MNNLNNIKGVGKQPIPTILRELLPVNYFMFAQVNEFVIKAEALQSSTTSTFHGTDEYYTDPFYKSISNIL